jgi:hypothetical protein
MKWQALYQIEEEELEDKIARRQAEIDAKRTEG